MSATPGGKTILTLLAVISLQELLLLAAPTSENAGINLNLWPDESAPASWTVPQKRQRRYRNDYWHKPPHGYSHGHSHEDSDEHEDSQEDSHEDTHGYSHGYSHGHSGRRSHGHHGRHSHGKNRPRIFGFGFGNWQPYPHLPVPFGFGFGRYGGKSNTQQNNQPDFQPTPESSSFAPTTKTTQETTTTATTTEDPPLLIDLRSGLA